MSDFEVYYNAGEVREGDPVNGGLSADDLPRLELATPGGRC